MKQLQLPFWNFFKELFQGQWKSLDFGVGEYWVCVLLALLILLAAGLIVWIIYLGIYGYFDKRSSTKETLSGELVDKRYIEEQSSSGVGTAVIPNISGGVGIGLVSTSSHSDEEFLFFVKADKVYKMEVDMQQFYDKNVGEKVRFEVTTGALSKDELNIELVG
jgi:hypothetical protein